MSSDAGGDTDFGGDTDLEGDDDEVPPTAKRRRLDGGADKPTEKGTVPSREGSPRTGSVGGGTDLDDESSDDSFARLFVPRSKGGKLSDTDGDSSDEGGESSDDDRPLSSMASKHSDGNESGPKKARGMLEGNDVGRIPRKKRARRTIHDDSSADETDADGADDGKNPRRAPNTSIAQAGKEGAERKRPPEADAAPARMDYPCPHPGCGMSFGSPGGMSVHHRSRHGGTVDWSAWTAFCARAAEAEAELIGMADEEATYPCPHPGCGMSFGSPAGLSRHQLARHAASGEAGKTPTADGGPPALSRCERDRLRSEHEKSGGDYPCPHPGCGLSYGSSTGLSNHHRAKHGKTLDWTAYYAAAKAKKADGAAAAAEEAPELDEDELASDLFDAISKRIALEHEWKERMESGVVAAVLAADPGEFFQVYLPSRPFCAEEKQSRGTILTQPFVCDSDARGADGPARRPHGGRQDR